MSLARIILSTTTLANANIGSGALLLVWESTKFESCRISVTLVHNSSAVMLLDIVLDVVDVVSVVVWLIVVVATDVPRGSRGSKKPVTASFVKNLPLHFSSSVKGVVNSTCRRFSSWARAIVAADFVAPPRLLLQSAWWALWTLLPHFLALHTSQSTNGSNASPPKRVCCPVVFCFFFL